MIGSSRNLTKSDTANDKFTWLLVTDTKGTVIVGQEGGNEVTIDSVPVGVWMPVGKATHVTTASTAVGIIVA